jgi:hypothetical protein
MGASYIFKGGEYLKFVNTAAQPGYPKSITEGFPGIPAGLDTAFVLGGNNKIYCFKVLWIQQQAQLNWVSSFK